MAWKASESLYKQSFHTNNGVNSTLNGGGATSTVNDNDQSMEVKTYCTRLREKITVVIELSPTDDGPARSLYGAASISSFANTSRGGSGGTRHGRSSQQGSISSAAPRPPLRLACVIDVSHSMTEPFGHDTETILDRQHSPVSYDDADFNSIPDSNDDDDVSASVSGGDGDSVGQGSRVKTTDRSRRHRGLGGIEKTTVAARKLSKLDRVKLFAELLIKTVGHDDQLAIVTFGTTAHVVSPMRRMTDDAKKETLTAVRSIEVAGVTNMSSGIFTAIEQFNIPFAKSRCFNDNVLLFTDGMANEGLADSTELIREIRKRIRTLKEECHFENDYTIKFSTLGTGGFLPELIYDIGQAFGSDAFYFLDDRMSMEMDLITPILLRQSVAVSNVQVTVTSLNGVQLDRTDVTTDYVTTAADPGDPHYLATTETYVIHEIAASMSKHIICRIKLPLKHKKLLKGNDVIKVSVTYKDPLLCSRSIEHSVAYSSLPLKDSQNSETDVLAVAREEVRRRAFVALSSAARSIARLDRAAARRTITSTVDQIREYVDSLFDGQLTDEDLRNTLSNYVATISSNLVHFDHLISDLAVRWDDAWARIKAVESSISREVPTSAGLYAPDAELFRAPVPMQERLSTAADILQEVYRSLGMSGDVLDKYRHVIEELEDKIDEDSLYGQSMIGNLG